MKFDNCIPNYLAQIGMTWMNEKMDDSFSFSLSTKHLAVRGHRLLKGLYKARDFYMTYFKRKL